MTEFELLFVSPEGQIQDTLHREWVQKPQAIALSNGQLFVTYFDYEASVNKQILLWAGLDGTILREDTLDTEGIVPLISYAYAEGTRAVLVEYRASLAGGRTVLEARLRPYEADGSALPVEPLYLDTLDTGEYSASPDPAFTYHEGVLKMLVPTVRQPSTPTDYRLRVVKHTPGVTEVFPEFNPGPLPAGYSAAYWTIAPTPWNMNVIAFAVQQNSPGTDRQLWIEGLDEYGSWPGMAHTIQIPSQWQANGVALAASGTTVYACYTQVSLSGEIAGGTYLTGFPLNELLDAEDSFVPRPSSYALLAYPNPFNAAVRLEYEIPAAADVSLTVYDLTGRAVATLAGGIQSAGRHTVQWSADALPSGLYFARLSAGDVTRTQKLVLLK